MGRVKEYFENLKQAAAEAEEIYSLDELEEYAEEQKQKRLKKEKDDGNEITSSHSRQG